MKIALIITKFPALHETFILDHIVGLIKRGHDVRIYATSPKDVPKVQPEVDQYKLLERTIYRETAKFRMPRNLVLRVLKAALLLMSSFLDNSEAALNSINVFRLGRAAVSLNAFYEARPFIT